MTFKHAARLPGVLLAAALLPLAAQAQQVERNFPLTSDTLVEVRNLHGKVTVQSWDQPHVRVVAMRRSDATEAHLEQLANRIHIHTHLLRASAPVADRIVDIEVWAPPAAALRLLLESGSLHVENFSEDVSVETVAADVSLQNLSGHTYVKTMNGSVKTLRCSGRMEISSISGGLLFESPALRNLTASTVSGDITYRGELMPLGSYEFQNNQGTIELLLPASASFELTADSVEGHVVTDFPLTLRSHGRQPRRSVQRSLLGTSQSGDALLRATSFSGTIRIRKQ